jgi:hypothetical protein
MHDQQIAFEVGQSPAAHYELEHAGLELHPSRLALDTVAAKLCLDQALPAHVSAIVHYDPLAPYREVRPTPADAEPMPGADIVIHVTTDTFGEATLTQRLGHAVFIHPLLNPDVSAAYTRHLERQHANRQLGSLGVVGTTASIAAPLANAALGRETNQPADVVLGMAGAVLLGVGVIKCIRERNRWQRTRPAPPDVSDLEPPLRVTSV